MVTISMSTEFYLVGENYYEEELAYQGEIDRKANGDQWLKLVSVTQVGDYVEISFQDADSVQAGKVNFFRPSDAKLDFSFPILDNLRLPKNEIPSGKWLVNLQWEFEGKQYVKEEVLYIGS